MTVERARARARWLGKQLGYGVCTCCGYREHVDICHIRPMSGFSEADLEKANSPANLAELCPNCHWRLDRSRLEIRIRNLLGTELYRPPPQNPQCGRKPFPRQLPAAREHQGVRHRRLRAKPAK